MNAKHTKTPWRYELGTKTIRSCKENYWLASMDSFDGAINGEANAAFIVRAVNSHDELLASLEKAVEILESEPEAYGIYKAHHAVFTTAIQKAKG